MILGISFLDREREGGEPKEYPSHNGFETSGDQKKKSLVNL